MYLVKTPFWLRALYPKLLWKMSTGNKEVFLTFDDGPHPTITPYVLSVLEKYNAKATFFCIGDNVRKYPETYQQILSKGHCVGNHTYNHLNGWKTDTTNYCHNIDLAQQLIQTSLFRPPYGRITYAQTNQILHRQYINKIVMWDVLSADFDTQISADQCTQNVIQHTRSGSIIVFHDSEKAWPRLEEALPATLEYLHQQGYRFKSIL